MSNEFYTCVNRIGNSILYRGYDESGEAVMRKEQFSPTLYLQTNNKSPYTSIDGTQLAARQFDTMREAKDFMTTYRDVDNFKVYGNTNYIAQFIYERYPNEIVFDRDTVTVATIDIEVATGIPKYSPDHKITVRKKL